MSATAEWIDNLIKANTKLNTRRYSIPKTYEFIRTLNFVKEGKKHLLQLIDFLNSTDDKVVVFANDTKLAYELHKAYSDSTFACGKSNDLYQYVDEAAIKGILENERFDTKFLFTTTVLDTGINLKDSELKHFVIHNVREEAIVKQCIGRNRGFEVNVYIQKWGSMHSTMKNSAKENFERMIAHNKIDRQEYIKRYGVESMSDNELIHHEIFSPEHIDYAIGNDNNRMKFVRVLLEVEELDLIIKNGYENYMAERLNKEGDWTLWEQAVSNGYLDSMVGIVMDKQTQEAFVQKLGAHNKDNKLLKSPKGINGWFEQRGMKYKLTSKRKTVEGKKITVWQLSS